MQQVLLLNSASSNANKSMDTSAAQGPFGQAGGASSGSWGSAIDFTEALNQVRRGLEQGASNRHADSTSSMSDVFPGSHGNGQTFSPFASADGTLLPPLFTYDGAGQMGFAHSVIASASNVQAFEQLTAQLSAFLQQDGVQQGLQAEGLDPELLAQLQDQIAGLAEELSDWTAQSAGAMNGVSFSAMLSEQGLGDHLAFKEIRQTIADLGSEGALADSESLVATLQTALDTLAQFSSMPHSAEPEMAGAYQSAANASLLSGLSALRQALGDGRSSTGALASQPSSGAWQVMENSGLAAPAGTSFTGPSESGVGGQGNVATQYSSGLQLGPGLAQMSAESDQHFRLNMDSTLSNLLTADSASELPDENPLRAGELSAAKVTTSTQNTANIRPYTASINTPVGDPEWAEKMNEKVLWMSSRGIQSAHIHLNPAELGPVDVKVSVQNEQTVVHFNVQNASVRELLESNVHRLRDMMDSGGVNLAQVDVDERSGDQQGFARQFGDESSGSQDGTRQEHGDSGDDSLTDATLVAESGLDGISIIDDYA